MTTQADDDRQLEELIENGKKAMTVIGMNEKIIAAYERDVRKAYDLRKQVKIWDGSGTNSVSKETYL